MIFVPCRDGLSHKEAEEITPEQAESLRAYEDAGIRAMAV